MARVVTAVRRLPWPFFLLFVGLAIAMLRPGSRFAPSSSIILAVFLPALLFDAGFSLEPAALRREWRWIALFGLLGSVLAAGIALLLLLVAGFDRGEALLLVAVLAATDPVSVFAALKRVAPPARLRVTLEGESLVNDGVAVVLTALTFAILSTGRASPVGLALLLTRLTLVGLVIGGLIGLVGRRALRRAPPLADIALTIGLAYAGYLVSDRLGGSGLLAVIGIAVMLRTASPDLKEPRLHRFWAVAGSVMAAAVFLLMGLQAPVRAVVDAGGRVVVVVLLLLLARAVMVVAITRVAPRLWPWRWQGALTWAGLRGALSLALALSAPLGLRGRGDLLALVVGFAAVSLAVQGLSIAPVFARLGVASVASAPA